MAKVRFVRAKGLNDIVAAIQGLQPGDEVAYCTSAAGTGAKFGLVGSEEDRIARNAAHKKAEGGAGMLFHRYVNGVYHHVIRGVQPKSKQILDDAAEAAYNGTMARS